MDVYSSFFCPTNRNKITKIFCRKQVCDKLHRFVATIFLSPGECAVLLKTEKRPVCRSAQMKLPIFRYNNGPRETVSPRMECVTGVTGVTEVYVPVRYPCARFWTLTISTASSGIGNVFARTLLPGEQ